MIARYQHKELTWIDVESPSSEEIKHLMEEYRLPELVAEEMVNATLRSKVDLYDDFMYVILHFPILHTQAGGAGEQEIDFVIGKDFVITIRYEPVEPLKNFAARFETMKHIGKDGAHVHGGLLFMKMTKELYTRSLHELDDIMNTIKQIENSIFQNQEVGMVRKILWTSRKLLDFKQALRFHRDILRSYETASKKFFGDEYEFFAGIIIAEYNKVNSLLEGLRDTLAELQRTNDSLLSTKSNDIMRALTIITFALTPFTLITGIFAMSMDTSVIFIKTQADFFFVIGGTLFIALGMFLFFRHKHWI